jgi:DNA/RNA endonuclease G (NUC1)
MWRFWRVTIHHLFLPLGGVMKRLWPTVSGLVFVVLATTACHWSGSTPSEQSNLASVQVLARLGVDSPPSVIGPVELKDNPNADAGLPKALVKRPEVLISRPEYVISWNPITRGPNWVAWRVVQADLGRGRFGNFMEDPALQEFLKPMGSAAVQWIDYKESCYDRGHMVPSGDRNSNPEHNQATFFTSNIWPQTGFLNRIAWNHLEMSERNLVQANGSVIYIFSGPLFEEDFGKIGSQKDIAVPSSFWKVILSGNKAAKPATARAEFPIAVIMPNKLSNGKKPTEDRETHCKEFSDGGLGNRSTNLTDWVKYKTTIAEIEKRTGLDIPEMK